MNWRINVASLLVFAVLLILYDQVQAQDSTKAEPKPQPNRLVVQISGGKVTTAESGDSSIELTLTIAPGVAIYTNKPHAAELETLLALPTKVEFLDVNGKVIDMKIAFPLGTNVESVMGDYRVFTGSVKLGAVFAASQSIERLRVKFAGYHFSGNVHNGVS